MQDSNYEASNALSTLEREAKELNLNSDQLNRQLEILKNSNFLGKSLLQFVGAYFKQLLYKQTFRHITKKCYFKIKKKLWPALFL